MGGCCWIVRGSGARARGHPSPGVVDRGYGLRMSYQQKPQYVTSVLVEERDGSVTVT